MAAAVNFATFYVLTPPRLRTGRFLGAAWCDIELGLGARPGLLRLVQPRD